MCHGSPRGRGAVSPVVVVFTLATAICGNLTAAMRAEDQPLSHEGLKQQQLAMLELGGREEEDAFGVFNSSGQARCVDSWTHVHRNPSRLLRAFRSVLRVIGHADPYVLSDVRADQTALLRQYHADIENGDTIAPWLAAAAAARGSNGAAPSTALLEEASSGSSSSSQAAAMLELGLLADPKDDKGSQGGKDGKGGKGDGDDEGCDQKLEGVTCKWSGCAKSRSLVECVSGKCQCKEGSCSDGAGKCVTPPEKDKADAQAEKENMPDSSRMYKEKPKGWSAKLWKFYNDSWSWWKKKAPRRDGSVNIGTTIASFFLGTDNCFLKALYIFFKFEDEDDYAYIPKGCFDDEAAMLGGASGLRGLPRTVLLLAGLLLGFAAAEPISTGVCTHGDRNEQRL